MKVKSFSTIWSEKQLRLSFPKSEYNTNTQLQFESTCPPNNSINSPKTKAISGHWRVKQLRTVYIWHLQDRGIWSKGKQKEFIPSAAIPSPGNSLPPGQSLTDLRGFCYQQVQMCQGEWRCHCPLPRDNSLLKTFPGHFRLACARGGFGQG